MAQAKTTAPTVTAGAAMPAVFYVLDTTAVEGNRIHEQRIDGIIKSFTFSPGKPLELAPAIALKFLKHDAFKACDKDGNLVAYKRPPKQPDELQAGEQIKLAEDETVARYSELSTLALQHRAVQMQGGERFADKPDRKDMIAFIVETKAKFKKANTSKEADVGPNDFVPESDLEEEAA